MNINYLKEIAIRVLDKNPHALISGSLALILQGYQIGRIPGDIDILIPDETDFFPLSDMTISNEGFYEFIMENHLFAIRGLRAIGSYEMANNLIIEVYQQQISKAQSPKRVLANGIPTLCEFEILKHKLNLIHYRVQREKHLNDIILVLQELKNTLEGYEKSQSF